MHTLIIYNNIYNNTARECAKKEIISFLNILLNKKIIKSVNNQLQK